MPDQAQTSAPPAAVVKAGEYLFREGERHGSLFVVESGQVELLRAFEAGTERLALLGGGDVLGEDAAFGRRAAGCSARAVTDSTVIRVSPEALHDALRARPDLAGHVIASLGRRLLEARVACVTAAGEGGPGTVRRPSDDAALPRLVSPDTGNSFPLPPGAAVAVVGRADQRTSFTPDIELSSLDAGRSLSRRHATIARQGAGFVLTEEARVTNGTFVNGQRVKPGVPTAITDGDEVRFGLVRTVFRTA